MPLDASCDDAARLAPLRDAFYDAEGARVATEKPLADWLRRYVARVGEPAESAAARRTGMDRVNPVYVPRNYLAQQAIDAATDGDTSVLERLLEVMRHPYDERPGCESYAARRPEWARHRAGCSALSCSS